MIKTTEISYIANIPDHLLPAEELENRRIWLSYSTEVALYLSTLDKYTIDDEFFIGCRGVCNKVFGAGLERVGSLIALTREEVARRCDLSPAELARLERVLGRLGLSLASDVSAWLSYRETVDPDFRLLIPYQMRLPSSGRSPLDT